MPATLTQRRAEHVVAFFERDGFVVDEVSTFLAEGLAAGEMVIAAPTAPHWTAITARLHRDGIAYQRAADEGRLRVVDAEHALEAISAGGEVSVERLRTMLDGLLVPGVRTRVYGEVVSLLAQRGDVDAAIVVEQLGHDLAHAANVRVLCGYHVTAEHPIKALDIKRIRQAHDRTMCEGAVSFACADAPRDAAVDAGVHAIRFYENRESLARIVGHFLGEGFVSGHPAIVIATPEHRDAIAAVLASRFFDVGRLEASGSLIMTDAEALLSQCMVDGMPDAARFHDAVAPIIERASRGRDACVVRAYGEMVDLLWKSGKTVAAVRLETLWNQLGGAASSTLLCGYSMGQFYKGAFSATSN